jgi:hypothetical protein
MAIVAKVETRFGEERELYIRLNHFDQLANHGVPARAVFRGYASEEAFQNGAEFMFEQAVEFPADAPSAPWKAAYAALAKFDPAAPLADELATTERQARAIGDYLEGLEPEVAAKRADYEAAIKARKGKPVPEGKRDILREEVEASEAQLKEARGSHEMVTAKLPRLRAEHAKAAALAKALAGAKEV